MNANKRGTYAPVAMIIAGVLLVGSSPAIRAGILTPSAATLPFEDILGISTIPGQAFGTVSQDPYTSSGGNVQDQITGCRISVTGCQQPPGPITESVSSQPVAVFSGMTSSFTLSALGNSDSLVQTITSGATSVPAPALYPAGISTGAGDYQQLTVTYTGTLPAPPTVGVDMTYSLQAKATDSSTGVSGSYTYGSFALTEVVDSTTIVDNTYVGQGGSGASAQGWAAGAFAGSFWGAPGSDSISGTDLLPLSVGTLYIVADATGSNVSFTSGGDYSGLDLNFAASLDPTFTIDSTWLAQNPQYSASDFTISQVYNSVPEPPTIALFGLGLIGLVLWKRRGAPPLP